MNNDSKCPYVPECGYWDPESTRPCCVRGGGQKRCSDAYKNGYEKGVEDALKAADRKENTQ